MPLEPAALPSSPPSSLPEGEAPPRPMPVWEKPFAFPSAAASELFTIAVNGNTLDLDRLRKLPWSSDPTDRLSAAFMTLAVQRRFALVPELLAWGVSPNTLRFDPRTAGRQPRSPQAPKPSPTAVLSEAMLAAPATVIRQLLNAGASWTYWHSAYHDRDPLMVVVQAPRPMWIDHDRFRTEQVERFDALLDLGFTPRPSTLTHGVPEAVATSVLPDLVQRLVTLGADPHALRTGTVCNALHLAVWESGRAALVGLLLDLGVDPFALEGQQRTPRQLLEERMARMLAPSEDDRANLARLEGLELRRDLAIDHPVIAHAPARARL